MNERYIEVNGLQVRYAYAGNEGPALILLHGLGSSLESWMGNVDALGKHFRVIAPDMLYFGKSAKPDRDPTQEDFTKFILDMMGVLGIERAILVGHSMGGMIATKTVLDYPGHFDGLVLTNPAGFGRELVWWLRLRTVLPLNINTEGRPPPWMMDFGLRQILHDPKRMPPETLEAIMAAAEEPGLMKAYHRVIKIGVDWRGIKPEVLEQVRDQAHRIDIPVMVIWGKQDRIVPVQQAYVIQERIPHARVEIFDSCGHAPMIEHADRFNALITEFVKEHVLTATPVDATIDHVHWKK